MPLTAKGYDRPELDDLREDINALFVKYFGDGVDMDDAETTGLLAGTLSDISEQVEELAQGIYNAMFVLKSNGANLDDLAAEEDVYRKPATYAVVDLQIDGYVDQDSPTIIPEGTQFSTPDGQIFATAKDITLSKQAAYVDAGGITQPLVDEDGNPLGRATVQANALESGTESNVMLNTIVNAEESIDGFKQVTNLQAATGGGDPETDDALRLRVLANRESKPNSTVSGIETAIKNVVGVQDVRLVNNQTMSTDSYGNPAKSLHLYVIGGDDATIAQTYFDHLPPITNTIGSVMGAATDIGGSEYIVMFDRAETVPIYVEVNLTVDETQFDTDNGPVQIKQAIMNYFDTLKMGGKVLYSKLFGPIYVPVGVNDATVKIGTAADALSTQDITISAFQLAVVSSGNITINVAD
ncbi:Phage Mu gp47 related protein [Lactobacillus buchneri CD034] [Lactiplantibacillus mudanjiangensis]|uniref:baseplate J/gp47 family protein n=1 Tax=Lactiplantibacillus mudanjiangensis TaxID=1296538 RepID=UPI0010144DA3|nr:Phage Mu gp47 related protein [Lactobacillus buchneri CD034] [Lactiplantibacillus mudanjiangensis]